MSRDKQYQRLLNSKRWKMIRADYLRQHPLCERCRREGIAAGVLPDGYVTSAVDVHHKIPVERAKTTYEMERLAYNMDGNNLEALCIPCHIKTHQEMRSHTKEKVAENKARARQRFMEANDPNYKREMMKQCVTKLTDGSEKGTMLDLFGEPIVIKQKKFKKHEDKLVVSVTFKMTDAEFKKLQHMADKFGMSTSRYCRDAVRQVLADHECILDPST